MKTAESSITFADLLFILFVLGVSTSPLWTQHIGNGAGW